MPDCETIKKFGTNVDLKGRDVQGLFIECVKYQSFSHKTFSEMSSDRVELIHGFWVHFSSLPLSYECVSHVKGV